MRSLFAAAMFALLGCSKPKTIDYSDAPGARPTVKAAKVWRLPELQAAVAGKSPKEVIAILGKPDWAEGEDLYIPKGHPLFNTGSPHYFYYRGIVGDEFSREIHTARISFCSGIMALVQVWPPTN